MKNVKQKIGIICEKAEKAGFPPFIQLLILLFIGVPFCLSIVSFVDMINSLIFMEKFNNCKTNLKNLLIFMSILNILMITTFGYLFIQLIKYRKYKVYTQCTVYARFLFDYKSSYLLLILIILSIIWLVLCNIEVQKEPIISNCRRPQFAKAFQSNYNLLIYQTSQQLTSILILSFYPKKTFFQYFLKCWLFYFSLGFCYSKEFPPLNFDSENEASGINRGDQYVAPTNPNEQQLYTNKTKNQQNLPDNQAIDNPPQILIPQNGQS